MSDTVLCAAQDCDEEFTQNTHNHIYHSPHCKRQEENRRRREMVSDITAAVSSMYMEDEEVEERLTYLRKENQRLARLVDKHKNGKAELVEAVYRGVTDSISKMNLKPITPPKNGTKKKGKEEVCNPWLSDWQLGKRTASYNSDVCAERIELFSDKILEITDVQRSDHPVKQCHVYLLGDIVEGEEIFQGQSHLIDSSLYGQIVRGIEITSDFLRRMLSTFDTVHVAGVIGNHGSAGGRNRRDWNDETNFDRLLYKLVSMLFAEEPRITFNIPDGFGERNFYAIDYIGDFGTLLIHGDQFSVPTSLHSYMKKILGWKSGSIPEHFDEVAAGHYHQDTKATFGTTVMRISPSPESDNTFAQEFMGAMGRPAQHLQFVVPSQGVSAEYTVFLDS